MTVDDNPQTTDDRTPKAERRPQTARGPFLVPRPASLVPSPWLRHTGLALLAALAGGVLLFLAARGISAAVLFVQQQELLGQVAGTLGGGIEGLANGDLRAARRALEQLDAQYWRLSVLVGATGAVVAAAVTYLRLERNSHAT